MKIVSKIILVSLLPMALISCQGGSAGNDKQAELEQLLIEQADINSRIAALREEIGSAEGRSNATLVSIQKANPATFTHYVEVQARVDGDDAVDLSPRMQGTVTRILVSEGDNVKPGQILAQIDDQIARQNLAEIESQYEFSKTVYEKRKALWEQRIGTELEYLSAKNNYQSLQKRRAAVLEQLDMTRIKSPIKGTVDNVEIKVGQAVMPGMPAIRVVNLSNLKVKGEVAESFAGTIKKDDEVILYFPDLGKEVEGKVGFASKVIDPLNRTFTVEVNLDADAGVFNPNMVAVMKISDYNNDEAFILPVDLIQSSSKGKFIMVAESKGNQLFAKRLVVETGKSYNGKVEIVSGIAPGEKIITNGYRDLNEGAEVRVGK